MSQCRLKCVKFTLVVGSVFSSHEQTLWTRVGRYLPGSYALFTFRFNREMLFMIPDSIGLFRLRAGKPRLFESIYVCF